MGFYLQSDGRPKGKAQYFVEHYGAKILPNVPKWEDVPEAEAVVCIVDNGSFEAAGYAYSKKELDEFADEDGRPRTWLLMNKELVLSLTGLAGENLPKR